MTGEITPETIIKSNTFIIWRGGTPKDFELKVDYRITSGGNISRHRRARPSRIMRNQRAVDTAAEQDSGWKILRQPRLHGVVEKAIERLRRGNLRRGNLGRSSPAGFPWRELVIAAAKSTRQHVTRRQI